MTDDEIITALECCNSGRLKYPCEICPLRMDDCEYILPKRALDIINQQKAEIERLKQENKEYCEDNRIIAYQRNQRDKEIRALHNQLNGLNFMDKQIKSEAIKKFAERLKNSAYKTIIKIMETEKIIFLTDELKLDKLVKEITEEQENGK